MSERLSHRQTAAMFALMTLARDVSNPDLRDAVGFALTGADRLRLRDLGLVTSRQVGRSYTHELTDRGWLWCEHELAHDTPPPPAPRSTLVRAAYLMFGGLHRYLQHNGKRPVDLFADLPPTPPPVDGPALQQRIRAAYRSLTRTPNGWVALVDLRPLLDGAERSDVDAALRALTGDGRAHLIPESNRKALTALDHAAALRLGGEDNHLLSIEDA